MKANKSTVANAKKRKAGGGRKPKGIIPGKSEVFTTRITPSRPPAMDERRTLMVSQICQVAERLLILRD